MVFTLIPVSFFHETRETGLILQFRFYGTINKMAQVGSEDIGRTPIMLQLLIT